MTIKQLISSVECTVYSQAQTEIVDALSLLNERIFRSGYCIEDIPDLFNLTDDMAASIATYDASAFSVEQIVNFIMQLGDTGPKGTIGPSKK